MFRNGDCGAENVFGKLRPVGGEGLHETAPGWAIFAQRGFGESEVAVKGYGGAVVKWVGQRCGRVDPFEAIVFEGQGREEGRAYSHGMDCGTEVVMEAGEGEFHRAGCAADGRLGFKDFDVEAGLGEDDSGC